jgi:hypothetical protein
LDEPLLEVIMLELIGSGVLGSVFGGLFRLLPEVIKFFDRKDERKHELAMFQLQTDLEKVKGSFKVEERYVDYGVAQLEAIEAAFKEQSSTASKSYKWVAALSALVRPMVTYVLFGMYVMFKLTMMYHGLDGGTEWLIVMKEVWTLEDFAMLNMILTFWFVGRAIEKYQHKA